jgi:hypothetical protein
MSDCDVIVIGAGPGGYPAAIRAAQLGKRVAIIEKERFGGTCLNWGCIPTKALIASSERYLHAREGAALGVTVQGVAFDYARMIARKNEIVGRLNAGVEGLLKAAGVSIIRGTARFEDARRVSVVTAISPRALVDVLFVLTEILRLIRRLSTLYGGRPGVIGFISLTRRAIGHLAITGGMAAGESMIQQVLGHGIAARISARLGEGDQAFDHVQHLVTDFATGTLLELPITAGPARLAQVVIDFTFHTAAPANLAAAVPDPACVSLLITGATLLRRRRTR